MNVITLRVITSDCTQIASSFFLQGTTDIAKYSLGRLRPHFITVCEPRYSSFNCTDSEVNLELGLLLKSVKPEN